MAAFLIALGFLVAAVLRLRAERLAARRVAAQAVTPPAPIYPVDLPIDLPTPEEDTADDGTEDSADPEWSGFPWYDSRSCWGCSKGCKASKFHPYAGSNIGAEIRAAGYSHAHGATGEPYHAGFAPSEHHKQVGREPSTSVKSLWESTCEACGRLVRRVQAGLEPSVVPMARVADEGCPF